MRKEEPKSSQYVSEDWRQPSKKNARARNRPTLHESPIGTLPMGTLLPAQANALSRS
jgi:hypothetical protein